MGKSYETDLSQGNVAKQLISFSLPFIFSSLIQNLYGMADLVIVGQFAGTVSLAGVNVSASVLNLLTNLAVGFCVGASAVIGRQVGSRRRDEVRRTIGNLCTFLMISAVVITVVLLAFQKQILALIQTPEEAYTEAARYLVICSIGTVFIFGYNALSAIFRGLGDSRRPFMIVLFTCVINILLDLILVGAFHMGASGAALATICSQAISMLVCIVLVKKDDFIFDFRLRSFGIQKDVLRGILEVSVPTALKDLVTSLSFVFLTALSSSLGVTEVAATGSAGKLINMSILASIAIGNSVSVMCAQNFGAGEEERAVRTMKVGIVMNLILNVILFILIQTASPLLLRIYGNDPDLIATGVVYLRSFTFDILFVPFMGNLCGMYIASGHSLFASVLNIMSSMVVRIPACYIFGIVLDMGVFGIGLGAPVASVVSSVVAVIYYFSGRWRPDSARQVSSGSSDG